MRARPRARPACALLLGALATAGAGCAGLTGLRHALFGPPRLADCPGPLVPVAELPEGDFLLRERVRVRGEGVDAGFELLAERRGERLVLVGLNAFGAKVFSLTQRDLGVEAESHLGPMLAVPPPNLLRDLHAARFAGSESPDRVEVARPGCGYTSTFVRVERRTLSGGP